MLLKKGIGPRRAITNKTIIAILAAVVLVGILGLCACGGLIYLGVTKMSTDFGGVSKTSESFLEAVKSDRIEAAYSQTTSAFQNRKTLDEFKLFLDRFATFKAHTSRSTSRISVIQRPGGQLATLKFTLFTQDNAMACTLVLVRQDGTWLVDKLTVP